MFSEKNIIHIENYKFKQDSEPKNRYLISLCSDNDVAVVLSTVTSQNYVPDYLKISKGRCLKNDSGTIHCYSFPKNLKIGENGFSFNKHSYVYISWNISILNKSDLQKYNPTSLKNVDVLKSDEYINLIYCIYNSKTVKRRIKRILEKKLEEIIE